MTNTNTTLHFLRLNLQTYNEMDNGRAYESNVGQKKFLVAVSLAGFCLQDLLATYFARDGAREPTAV